MDAMKQTTTDEDIFNRQMPLLQEIINSTKRCTASNEDGYHGRVQSNSTVQSQNSKKNQMGKVKVVYGVEN